MATSSNPLDEWRKKSTFDVTLFKNFLYTEEVVEFKNQIWGTLAKDPLFSFPEKELTLDETRELAFKRLKRMMEYRFITDDMIVQCPLKIPALTSSLIPFDTGMIISWQLNSEVSSLQLCVLWCIPTSQPTN